MGKRRSGRQSPGKDDPIAPARSKNATNAGQIIPPPLGTSQTQPASKTPANPDRIMHSTPRGSEGPSPQASTNPSPVLRPAGTGVSAYRMTPVVGIPQNPERNPSPKKENKKRQRGDLSTSDASIRLPRKLADHKLTPPTHIVGHNPQRPFPQDAQQGPSNQPSLASMYARRHDRNASPILPGSHTTALAIPDRVRRDRRHERNDRRPREARGRSRRPSSSSESIEDGQLAPHRNRERRPREDSRHKGRKSYAAATRPKTTPKWSQSEIRMYAMGEDTPLQMQSWKSLEAPIIQAHHLFLREIKLMENDVKVYCLQRLYFDTDLRCGVLEVAPGANAQSVRDDFIPTLELPIQLKAMINSDNQRPIVHSFSPHIYEAFSPEEFLESLQWMNPILEEQPFQICQPVKKNASGILYSFLTTTPVVEYIRQKGWRLQHGLGQTSFNQHIDYEVTDVVLTKLKAPTKPAIIYYQDQMETNQNDNDLASTPQVPPLGAETSVDNDTEDPLVEHEAYLAEQEEWISQHGAQSSHIPPFVKGTESAFPFMEEDVLEGASLL